MINNHIIKALNEKSKCTKYFLLLLRGSLTFVEHLINNIGNACLLQVHEDNNIKKYNHLVSGLALPLICVF